ncbi:hypothetical protein ANCCAN_26502, partial [Ancylostoma caninum]
MGNSAQAHSAPTDSLRTSPRTICDLGFDLILTKLSSGLTPDTAGKFELTGVEYRLRDFVVRVGTASQVTTTKGVIVEVIWNNTYRFIVLRIQITQRREMFEQHSSQNFANASLLSN